ncbi:MAG: histidine phosphatase family protein, partial [Rubrivivax sp.]
MGTLYLVRHGQASFGAEDYDQLSALGRRQAVRLGEYFRDKGLVFDAVLTGTLRRHVQTWDGIAEGLGLAPQTLPWAGLNEYDSAALIATVHPQPLGRAETPEQYRHHFRLLREALSKWMRGESAPAGMPDYTNFLAGVTTALDHVRANHHGARVLAVTSGGPIATAVSHVLGTGPDAAIELNLRIRNTAVTEFVFTPKRHMLLTFNTLPHLDAPQYA